VYYRDDKSEADCTEEVGRGPERGDRLPRSERDRAWTSSILLGVHGPSVQRQRQVRLEVERSDAENVCRQMVCSMTYASPVSSFTDMHRKTSSVVTPPWGRIVIVRQLVTIAPHGYSRVSYFLTIPFNGTEVAFKSSMCCCTVSDLYTQL